MTEEIANPWDEWLKTAELDPEYARLPERIRFMRSRHGKRADHRCKECASLRRFFYHTKTYNKCQRYGITHGAATDWRLNWPACGLFKDRGAPVETEHRE